MEYWQERLLIIVTYPTNGWRVGSKRKKEYLWRLLMQAVVEAPPMQNTDEPVSFKVSGKNIPRPVIAFLDALFPDSVRIEDDDDVLEPVEEMDWYKKAKKNINPAKTLKIMRVNAGLTQAQLAQKVGLAKQNYNSLERGARPISMLMSKKLADALGTSYLMFFRENKSQSP